MKIAFHNHFLKNFEKLSPKQRERVNDVLSLFQQDPHDVQLKNHILHGDQRERRAISAGGDLRLIFIEENNYEFVQFLAVGSHNQVY